MSIAPFEIALFLVGLVVIGGLITVVVVLLTRKPSRPQVAPTYQQTPPQNPGSAPYGAPMHQAPTHNPGTPTHNPGDPSAGQGNPPDTPDITWQ